SRASVGVFSILVTMSMPDVTLPNTGCFEGPGVNQSRYELLTVLRKNWQLPLLGRPVFAIESVPGSLLSLAFSGCSSSMQPSGPLPVPADPDLGSLEFGQSNWSMKPLITR